MLHIKNIDKIYQNLEIVQGGIIHTVCITFLKYIHIYSGHSYQCTLQKCSNSPQHNNRQVSHQEESDMVVSLDFNVFEFSST